MLETGLNAQSSEKYHNDQMTSVLSLVMTDLMTDDLLTPCSDSEQVLPQSNLFFPAFFLVLPALQTNQCHLQSMPTAHSYAKLQRIFSVQHMPNSDCSSMNEKYKNDWLTTANA